MIVRRPPPDKSVHFNIHGGNYEPELQVSQSLVVDRVLRIGSDKKWILQGSLPECVGLVSTEINRSSFHRYKGYEFEQLRFTARAVCEVTIRYVYTVPGTPAAANDPTITLNLRIKERK